MFPLPLPDGVIEHHEPVLEVVQFVLQVTWNEVDPEL